MRLRFHLRRFWPLYCLVAVATGILTLARVFTSPNDFDWPAWVQAVGSIGAILVAIWVSADQAEQQHRREAERDRNEMYGMLQSLHSELETTLVYLTTIISPRLRETEQDEIVYYTFPLPEYPFPIFDSLIPNLGIISDRNLHKKIIHTFAHAKSLAMTISQHNRLLENYTDSNARFKSHGMAGSALAVARSRRALFAYTASFRTAFDLAHTEIVSLQKILADALHSSAELTSLRAPY